MPPKKKRVKTLNNWRLLLIGHPVNIFREVCCFPGAHVRDVKKSLPHLIKQGDCHLLVGIQEGLWEAAVEKQSSIKRDFAYLGKMLKGLGAHVCCPPNWWLGSGKEEEDRSGTLLVDGVRIEVLGTVITGH